MFVPASTRRSVVRRETEPAWVAVGDANLEQILCHEEARVVGQDNTVTIDTVALQIAKQPGRRTCAGLAVIVRRIERSMRSGGRSG